MDDEGNSSTSPVAQSTTDRRPSSTVDSPTHSVMSAPVYPQRLEYAYGHAGDFSKPIGESLASSKANIHRQTRQKAATALIVIGQHLTGEHAHAVAVVFDDAATEATATVAAATAAARLQRRCEWRGDGRERQPEAMGVRG